MTSTNKTRRRVFGAACLFIAIAMLVVEATVLQGRITGVPALGYWLACSIFTALAVFTALFDLRALRTETRDEHRALFESTLQKIQEEKAKAAGGSTKNPPPRPEDASDTNP